MVDSARRGQRRARRSARLADARAAAAAGRRPGLDAAHALARNAGARLRESRLLARLPRSSTACRCTSGPSSETAAWYLAAWIDNALADGRRDGELSRGGPARPGASRPGTFRGADCALPLRARGRSPGDRRSTSTRNCTHLPRAFGLSADARGTRDRAARPGLRAHPVVRGPACGIFSSEQHERTLAQTTRCEGRRRGLRASHHRTCWRKSSPGRNSPPSRSPAAPRPKLMFEKLAATRFAWDQVHLFWVDERCVPPTDASSNFKLAERLPDPAGAHSAAATCIASAAN